MDFVSAGAIGWQLQGSPTAELLADRRHRRQKVAANWTDLMTSYLNSFVSYAALQEPDWSR